jgi:hypothetical protein
MVRSLIAWPPTKRSEFLLPPRHSQASHHYQVGASQTIRMFLPWTRKCRSFYDVGLCTLSSGVAIHTSPRAGLMLLVFWELTMLHIGRFFNMIVSLFQSFVLTSLRQSSFRRYSTVAAFLPQLELIHIDQILTDIHRVLALFSLRHSRHYGTVT